MRTRPRKAKKRVKILARKHRDALEGSSLTSKADLLARLNTAFAPFEEKYDAWLDLRGQQKGAVIVLDDLFAKLSATDTEDLDVAIKGVFKRTTPEYARLFPQGREPFHNGTDGERVDAVAALKTTLEKLAGITDPPTPGVVPDPKVTPLIAAVDAVLQPLLTRAKEPGPARRPGGTDPHPDRAIAQGPVRGFLQKHRGANGGTGR